MIKHLLPCVLLSASCLASAAPVVDQVSPLPQTGLQIFYRFSELQPVTYAQSFRPAQASMSGAGVSYANNIDGVIITISLYDKLPTEGGTLLASANTGATTEAVDFLDAFWNPVAVQPLQQYYLLFTANSVDAMFFGSNGSYAEGRFEGFDTNGYTAMPEADLAFRTFADDGVVAEVSEPRSLALLALGLFGLGAARRRLPIE